MEDLPKRITWDDIDVDQHVSASALLGYKQHGVPVRGRDENAYWVESVQWKVTPDGSREERRYHLMRLKEGRVESYPFDSPSRIMDYPDEQQARTALVCEALS